MELALYVAGFAAMAVGIAGLVLPAVPGSALIVAGAVAVGWADDFTRIGWGTLTAVIVLGVLIWLVDLAASVLGARAFGASRWAVIGAGVGVLAGLFLGPVGILLGPAVGAIVVSSTPGTPTSSAPRRRGSGRSSGSCSAAR